MQEKIGFVQHPIKLFDHQPPPTSWVKENLESYYWLRVETEFLSDMLSYMQGMQTKPPSKATPKPLELKETMIPLPIKGSASEISNSALFNVTQGYVKAEMEHLENMLRMLKQANPSLSHSINQMMSLLKQQIEKTFPNLSQQQLQSLNQSQNLLFQLAGKAPLPYQRTFWNMQLTLLRSLFVENGENINYFEAQTKEMQARSKTVETIQRLTKTTQDLLATTKLTTKKFIELVHNLQDLANKSSFLTPSQNQALGTFFAQLRSFKSAKGTPLVHMAADILIQTKLQAFLKKNPAARADQIKGFLNEFLKKSNLNNQKSNFPFMEDLGKAIEEVVNKKGFPQTKGLCGYAFNEELISRVLSDYSTDDTSIQLQTKASEGLIQTLSDERAESQVKIEAYSEVVKKLKGLQDLLHKSSFYAVGQRLAAGVPPPGSPAPGSAYPGADGQSDNLPNEFSNAIINHFIPIQEAYLENLAMTLYLDNNGAMFGNTLLNDMLGFGGAADNFGFSNWLHSSGSTGEFAGNYKTAKEQLANERVACQNAMDQINKSLGDITTELQSINQQLQNPNLTPAQRQILENQQSSLQDLRANLIALYNPGVNPPTGQLVQLQNLLNSIHVEQPTFMSLHSQRFIVNGPAGWQSDLSTDENAVINGAPNKSGQTVGGLVNVQAQAQTFQQTYSDMGQNDQLKMEMMLTVMQQDWTACTTGMQLLNQMYMTISRNLYK